MAKFTCCKCKGTFKKINNDAWNEYKAAEEFINSYPEAKNDATDILCGSCNEEFKKWFSSLTNEEKEIMRNKNYD